MGNAGLAECLSSTSATKQVAQVSLNPLNRGLVKQCKWKQPWMLLVIWRMDFFWLMFLGKGGKIKPRKATLSCRSFILASFLALFFSNVIVFLKRPSAGGFLNACDLF